MAPQFGPQSATLVPVYPDEESRMRNWGRAVSHTVGPVLGETVVLCGRGQTAVGYRQSHRDVGPAAGHIVPPQGRYRLLDAAFTCGSIEILKLLELLHDARVLY